MKLFLEIILLCYFAGSVNPHQATNQTDFQYEKRHLYGFGKRIPDFSLLNRKYQEYPQPLPSPSTEYSAKSLLRQPYTSLYQGTRASEDVRVYRKVFNYPAAPVGHRVICEELLDCTITFLSVETKTSIPIMLRGGAGYRHFTVVVRAKPWEPLEGHIQAYCRPVKEKTL